MTTLEEAQASFEELSAWEYEFDDARLEILRKQEALLGPLYTKRQAIIEKIPAFWPLVFEQAPPEFDTFIQPSDSQLFADCFKGLDVKRFEIDDPKGSPRSVSVKFEFSENKYFENTVLEKKFSFRRSSDGWSGLVSEPVKINWKKGEDLTKGLTDAVFSLWEATQKNGGWNKESLKSAKTELQALTKKLGDSDEASVSFFAWFSFMGEYRYVTAEESAAATAKEAEHRQQLKEGKKVEPEEDEDEDDDEEHVEAQIFYGGDDLTQLLVDDIWPSAFDYFTSAHEQDDEDLSELEMDEFSEDDDEAPVDIRALVGKGKKDKKDPDAPPSKKRKT